jgi:tetratricopeptide (TPR) repeat protein
MIGLAHPEPASPGFPPSTPGFSRGYAEQTIVCFSRLQPASRPGFSLLAHCAQRSRSRTTHLALALLTLTLLLPGCSAFREKILSPGVTATREERSAQVLREFEDRRDAAQLAAALDRLNQGDISRAQSMLTVLVNRRPDFADARLRLAEILASRSDPAAEAHLRAILATDPTRPDAHHALGLYYSSTNRPTDALHHLSKAADLDPENQIYRATYESLAAAPPSIPAPTGLAPVER